MNIVPRRRRETGLASFRDLWDDMFDRFWADWRMPALAEGAWAPVLDVDEREDAILVSVEVPGMKPEEIDLSVHGNLLTVSGEKKESAEKKEKGYYRSERRYGSFRRDITLPADVDAEKVDAVCRDGVLTITLPKVEHAKIKTIKVKS